MPLLRDERQAIYAYFGSQEGQFDAVLQQRLGVLADAVPLDPADLPGYAGALFDELTADRGLQRLTQWKALERPGASPAELAAHRSKAEAIAGARATSIEAAMDALMLAIAMAQAWNQTPPAIRDPDGGGDEPARRARHRAALVAASRGCWRRPRRGKPGPDRGPPGPAVADEVELLRRADRGAAGDQRLFAFWVEAHPSVIEAPRVTTAPGKRR